MTLWGKLRTAVLFSVALTMPLVPCSALTEHNVEDKMVQGATESEENANAMRFREPRGLGLLDDQESDVAVTGLTPQQILDILLTKYRSKIHPEARMMFSDFNDKDIGEICGTSASLRCGNEVLLKIDDGEDVDEKCELRKTFLECIDASRRECRLMAKNGLFPVLPPKSEISKIQRKVWRALWTSGGCVLGY